MAGGQGRVSSNTVTAVQQGLGSVKRELIGLALVVLAVIALLSLFSVTSGAIGDGMAGLLRQIFGWGAIPFGLAVAGIGVWLVLGRLLSKPTQPASLSADEWPAGVVRWEVVIAIEILFAAGLALLHMLMSDDDPLALAWAGYGGGLLGWGLSAALIDLAGKTITGVALLVFLLAALGLLLRASANDAVGWLGRTRKAAQTDDVPRSKSAKPVQIGEADVVEERREAKPERARLSRRRVSPGMETVPLRSQSDASPRPARRSKHLPPLDLLVPSSQEPTAQADVRYQAQIIEETLQAFGVPVRVREINVGPAVTQFGVEPGYIERPGPDGELVRQRVRVRKITVLTNDLSLALSAAPIRIEAPVPGRPLVGIEVPNSKVSLVSLRGVLESEVYRKARAKGTLPIALGRDVSGAAVVADLASMPHLLIAGATGSGKSVCINAILTGLLCDHSPDDLKILMIDPKMVELVQYTGTPHLLAPVIVDLEQVVGALAWVVHLMDERYQLFAEAGARNIAEYNKGAARRRGEELLPYIIVVVDELADLMMMAPDEVERSITRIAQMARATGIHLIIATQRPSVDVVTGLIKANFPARIAFMVTSQVDSRVILDASGAERLLGRGDCLLMLPDSAKLQRLQGCFVSDQEIGRIVNFWKEAMDEVPAAETLPWEEFIVGTDKDAMLEQAIDLVLTTGRASTTLLQRRLGIGYPRAARLMDQLEEEGVIGPAAGSQPREVLIDSRDELDGEVSSDEAWDGGTWR
jgi:S-DNA-T family DNA segregation ATPase FtsK/SpoIIIE